MRRQNADALTAREREVLDLIRLGLTNEEIAGRLDITLDGAKYHVSQILSKLGAATREEAATWRPEAGRAWLARWPVWARIAGTATVAAAVAGLAILAWGVIQTSGPAEPATSQNPPALVAGAVARMRSLNSYTARVQAMGADNETFVAEVSISKSGGYQNRLYAAEDGESRLIAEAIVIGSDLFQRDCPEEQCSQWHHRAFDLPAFPTFFVSATSDLETLPFEALEQANDLEVVGQDNGVVHISGAVNTHLALYEHQKQAWDDHGFDEVASGFTFDEAYREQIEPLGVSDLAALPSSPIDVAISLEDNTVLDVRFGVDRPNAGELPGSEFHVTYSAFNAVEISPPDEYVEASPMR